MAQAPGYHGLDWQRRTNPVLDPEAVLRKLRQNELSIAPDVVSGSVLPVSRFDMLRLESTWPCQDNFTYESADVGNGSVWQFWGVFDGHAGWQTSDVLRQSLVSYVVRELKEMFTSGAGEKDNAAIDAAIKKGFVRLDDEIMSRGLAALNQSSLHRAEVIADIMPCVHGSMAVLAAYDPSTSTLRVASVGDSSAILGRRPDESSSKWEAVPILVSHSLATNTEERERLIAAHPNEPDLIEKDRVLGLPVSRAFGDHRLKWPAEAIDKASDKFYGQPKRDNYISPPYIHAEPDVVTTVVQPGDFAILATDGLWDSISHEDATTCLGMWIAETNRRVAAGERQLDGTAGPDYAESVPLEGVEIADTQIGGAWSWLARPEDMVVEDGNAATHLARNVLGGKRREQFTTVMSVAPPTSYEARDDITVQVLFFGDVVSGGLAQSGLTAF